MRFVSVVASVLFFLMGTTACKNNQGENGSTVKSESKKDKGIEIVILNEGGELEFKSKLRRKARATKGTKLLCQEFKYPYWVAKRQDEEFSLDSISEGSPSFFKICFPHAFYF